jgi:hypothetical protein
MFARHRFADQRSAHTLPEWWPYLSRWKAPEAHAPGSSSPPRAESPRLVGLVTKGSWNQLMMVLGCTHEVLLCFSVWTRGPQTIFKDIYIFLNMTIWISIMLILPSILKCTMEFTVLTMMFLHIFSKRLLVRWVYKKLCLHLCMLKLGIKFNG